MKNKLYLNLAILCVLFNTCAIYSEVTDPVSNQQDTKQLEEAQAKQLREAQLKEARERQLREIKEKLLRDAQEKELKEDPIKRARRIRAGIAAVLSGANCYFQCYKEDPRNVNNSTTALNVAGNMAFGAVWNYYVANYLRGFLGFSPTSYWF